MDVKTLRLQAELAAACERRGRLLRRQPELRAAVARGNRPVRVGVDSRRHAHEDALHAGGRCPLGVIGSVEHDKAAGFCRRRELLICLVVPVQHDLVAADAGAAGERELAERRSLRAEPLPREDAQHCDVGKRLHAVEDCGVPGCLPVRARPRPQCLLAVDDERRAVRLGERRRREAAEPQFAALDRRRVGEERQLRHDFDASRRYTAVRDAGPSRIEQGAPRRRRVGFPRPLTREAFLYPEDG